MAKQYFDEALRYVQEEFGRQPPFSSFLPGIAGPFGIPAWCNYNNRGQAVCSFGVQDKDHAILEFTAASTAYRQTPLTGFRTFLKADGRVTEPFADGLGTMLVESNALSLRWQKNGFGVEVLYFTLPNERMAGLCRKFTVTNTAAEPVRVELLDGLASIVPYGVKDEKLKQEANLSTAWMQVEGLEESLPVFRVRASMEDTAAVTAVTGANFRLAFAENRRRLPAIVQPSIIFDWDTTLQEPVGFQNYALKTLLRETQQTSNFLPCCLTAWAGVLAPAESVTLWEFYGQGGSEGEIRAFCERADTAGYFEGKLREARQLAADVTRLVRCRTANQVLDGYVAQNFLDNVLRGGLPCGVDTPVYLYSRKHGDPEREYNFFSLGQEYFSQGNGNFRDICQNRRSDTFLSKAAGEFNIQLFAELLQPDGYNPLVVEPVNYFTENGEEVAQLVPPQWRKRAKEIFSDPFSPGRLAMEAESWGVSDPTDFLSVVLSRCAVEPNAIFDTGYWCDHWTYLLDLIENYVSVYPDLEQELLFCSCRYRWYAGRASVRPQPERYCATERGLRQYHCIQMETPSSKWVQTRSGEDARSTLAEKLLLLCAVKYATLDLSGAAVEMEGGKPGWYDALNGLPGLLGSGVAEGCELLRLLQYFLARGGLFPEKISLYCEIAELFANLSALDAAAATPFEKWLARNRLRDRYRAAVRTNFSGDRICVKKGELLAMLSGMEEHLREAIQVETQANGGICPTYFYYHAPEYKSVPSGILPKLLEKISLPLFLEGPTRYLRTKLSLSEKKRMAAAVKDSPLFDRELQMYRLNDSLKAVTHEVGRASAFTPGWLENGSIWLHMEYKYLLALLEGGLYDEFFEAFTGAAVPFLSLEQYGRSTLENSSFLVSSANPDTAAHGRGFVARLTGSTAELISIWNLMLFGKTPFQMGPDGLFLKFSPAIPGNLLPVDGTIMGTFLGTIPVLYHTVGLAELRPGAYEITRYQVRFGDGPVTVSGPDIPGPCAEQIRERRAERIDVYILPAY